MKHIEINLGRACNNRCRFCMSGRISNLVDFGQAEKEILTSAQQGYTSLGFLGGEVTLHPRLLDLIKLAKDNGFEKVHIISNGRKYADDDFLRSIIDAGVDRFSVSIHSHRAEIEDYLTQVKGGFAEKIKGLKNLKNFHDQELIKNNISINIVINKKNYQDILKTLQYFNSLGFADFRLNFMWPEGNASNYYPELIISYSEFYPFIAKIISLAKRLKFHLVFEGIPFCVFPQPQINKEFVGELRDVSTDVITYEKHKVNRFNWQERKNSELKGKSPSCKECVFYDYCEGVWLKYIEHFDWQEFRPILK